MGSQVVGTFPFLHTPSSCWSHWRKYSNFILVLIAMLNQMVQQGEQSYTKEIHDICLSIKTGLEHIYTFQIIFLSWLMNFGKHKHLEHQLWKWLAKRDIAMSTFCFVCHWFLNNWCNNQPDFIILHCSWHGAKNKMIHHLADQVLNNLFFTCWQPLITALNHHSLMFSFVSRQQADISHGLH